MMAVKTLFTFASILILPCLAAKSDYEKTEGVLILNNNNYHKAVAEFEHLLVYFYAPWCGHCKALGPEFVKAGQMLREKDSAIKLGMVDGTEEPELLDKHKVTGYPTLKLYRSGEMVPYTGGRMAPEMVDWLEKKIGPPAKVLESLEEVEKFVTASDVAVVGFFTKESAEKSGWLAACLDYDDYGVHYPVAVTADSAAAEKFGVSNGVVLFRGKEQIKYSGDYTVQNLRDFMTEQAIPLIVEFSHETAQQIFKPPNNQKSHLLVFHEGKQEQQTKDVKEVMKKVGGEFKDQVIFVSVDVDVEDHRRMVEFLGIRHRINNDTYPTFRVVTMKDSLGPVRYRPEVTSVEENNLRTFLNLYTQGKISREYFVEPLPKDWNDKDVKYLTAVNVKEMTESPETQALVMYYAPWCGHCKTLMPVWEALGKKYSNGDTVIAKMDATVNEVEGMEKINSFPTIRLHRKDGTQAEYNGERTVEGITKFLDSDGVYGMAAPDHDEL